MDQWYVLGFKPISFTAKDNSDMKGYKIYLSRQPDSDSKADELVQGEITEVINIWSAYVSYIPCVGDEIILRYNRYGKISSIETR